MGGEVCFGPNGGFLYEARAPQVIISNRLYKFSLIISINDFHLIQIECSKFKVCVVLMKVEGVPPKLP